MSVVSEGFAGKQGGSFSGGSEETYLENPRRLGKGAFSFLAFFDAFAVFWEIKHLAILKRFISTDP